jgi:hypothetical protein
VTFFHYDHRLPGGGRARWAALAVALVAVATLATGCDTASQVPWATYDPAVQQQIDSAAAQKDCATLADLHQKAHSTSKAHEKATGVPNDALISYIETAQRAAGCTT